MNIKSCEFMGESSSRDRISNLPEEVRHHILSFLSTSDAIRTSLLSSTWRYVWIGLPFLDFGELFWKNSKYCKPAYKRLPANPLYDDIYLDLNNGDGDEEEEEEEGNLIDYADSSLRTGALGFVLFIDQIVRILKSHPHNQTRKLRLFLQNGDVFDDDGVSMDIASTNGDELHMLTDFIHHSHRGYKFQLVRYLIAASDSLIELHLQGSDIFYTTIEFPSLRKVSIDNIDERVLEHLRHSCSTTLEELAFYCYSDDNSNLLRVYGFPKLRVLQIRVFHLENLKVDAPDLHSLSIGDLTAQCSVNWTSLRNLVKLKLDDCDLTNGFFDDVLVNFARLESFHITYCYGQTHIKICSKSLTNLVISMCGDLKIIEIDTPNLKSFSLYTSYIVRLFCKSPIAPQNAFIFFNSYSSSITEHTKWLTEFVKCQTSAFYGPGNEGMIIPQELRESSSPLLSGVQRLHVFLNFPCPPTNQIFLQYMAVVLQLFSHPKTFVLSTTTYVEEDIDWNLVGWEYRQGGKKTEVEFQYKEESGEVENSCGCYPVQPINCWRHSLTGFKIKKQEGLKAANVKKFFEDVLAERRKQ